MPRQLEITSGQQDASQRNDLAGLVYILSGTLKGRGVGTADLGFAWATRTFSGTLGKFDEYIGQPATIERAQAFLGGDSQSTDPAIRVPVRNLPFASGASMLQLIDDGTYAWEDSEASLRVAYIPPGQQVSGLAATEWTYLVKRGFLGPPEQIDLDGFQLPLYSRAALQNRVYVQPRMPGEAAVRASGSYPILKRDLGRVVPLVVGCPDTWYRPPTTGAGVRGYTLSAYNAGETLISFLLSTVGQESNLTSTFATLDPTFLGAGTQTLYGTQLSGCSSVWFIHRQDPVYPALPLGVSGSSWSEASGVLTIKLASGLASTVPKGALVIEAPYRTRYHWAVSAFPSNEPAQHHTPLGIDTCSGNVGFLFPDGSTRVADTTVWRWEMSHPGAAAAGISYADGADVIGPDSIAPTILELPVTARKAIISGTIGSTPLSGSAMFLTDQQATSGSASGVRVIPPVWFDPSYNSATVLEQPEFTSPQTLTKVNYPTGGTGANNANARDGNELTAASLAVAAVITLTFNSAPSPFVDGDTVESTLHAMTQGDITFTDSTGSTTFGVAAGTGGVTSQWRFTQASPRDFNETVRCVGAGGSGGSVVEVWWEHTLVTDATNTRTQDVVVGGAGGLVGAMRLGAELEDSEVVFRQRARAGTFISYFGNSSFLTTDSGNMIAGSFIASGLNFDTADQATYPTSVMLALRTALLGTGNAGFTASLVNSGAYRVAHSRFVQQDLRLNFILDREVSSWSELESMIALQSRSYAFFGPSGHEMVFMESASGASASGVLMDFALVGVPTANAVKQSGRSLLERTRVDEIVNSVTANWHLDHITGNPRGTISGTDATSLALFGPRRDPRGELDFWAHATFPRHTTFNGAAGVSGITSFYATRGAFALTRFHFETAWPAFFVERGSPILVVYQVAVHPDPDEAYRNVVAEVESVRCDPINGGRFYLTARGVEVPSRGLPARIWIDRFTDDAQVWTDKISSTDQWRNRWSV